MPVQPSSTKVTNGAATRTVGDVIESVVTITSLDPASVNFIWSNLSSMAASGFTQTVATVDHTPEANAWSGFSNLQTLVVATDQNNLAAPLAGFEGYRCVVASNHDWTGMVAGVDGEIRLLLNVGPAEIALIHASSSSALLNRFYLVNGADMQIREYGSCVFRYDAGVGGWLALNRRRN